MFNEDVIDTYFDGNAHTDEEEIGGGQWGEEYIA